ncbi:hypothetical protein Pmani_033522 [Petrolisthes manimaculis]|uniref:Uncharacterized protein n=1 Tax=Petrolisthes manimaculis TaxID=1843537 RepID=A0AAE1NQA8_9EUCA|nr:hypothetical protein Pmani_033522 [Petrolisthes manimaculis]
MRTCVLVYVFLFLVTGSQSLMFKPSPEFEADGRVLRPGNRLRNYYGSRVYTYSCPCGAGLSCKPRWSSTLYGRSVMEDPKCMPETMHPYILAIRGHGYNVYDRHNNVINIVPAE